MARSRNIKPGFFLNDTLAEVPPLARLLFIALWTIADRAGRLDDRPLKIKAQCLPYDQADVDELLQCLALRGFLVRYSVAGLRFIQIVNWDKHQDPHCKEKASDIPAPPEHGASTVQAQDKHGSSTEEAPLIPDSLNLIPSTSPTPPPAAPEPGPPKAKTERRKRGEPSQQALKAFPRDVVQAAVEMQRVYPHSDSSGREVRFDFLAVCQGIEDRCKQYGEFVTPGLCLEAVREYLATSPQWLKACQHLLGPGANGSDGPPVYKYLRGAFMVRQKASQAAEEQHPIPAADAQVTA